MPPTRRPSLQAVFVCLVLPSILFLFIFPILLLLVSLAVLLLQPFLLLSCLMLQFTSRIRHIILFLFPHLPPFSSLSDQHSISSLTSLRLCSSRSPATSPFSPRFLLSLKSFTYSSFSPSLSISFFYFCSCFAFFLCALSFLDGVIVCMAFVQLQVARAMPTDAAWSAKIAWHPRRLFLTN